MASCYAGRPAPLSLSLPLRIKNQNLTKHKRTNHFPFHTMRVESGGPRRPRRLRIGRIYRYGRSVDGRGPRRGKYRGKLGAHALERAGSATDEGSAPCLRPRARPTTQAAGGVCRKERRAALTGAPISASARRRGTASRRHPRPPRAAQPPAGPPSLCARPPLRPGG